MEHENSSCRYYISLIMNSIIYPRWKKKPAKKKKEFINLTLNFRLVNTTEYDNPISLSRLLTIWTLMTECFYSLVIILWWISEFEFQDSIQYYDIGQISPELQVKGEKEMSIDQ
jgi:hypothetical protein